jgi:hypothetical protein
VDVVVDGLQLPTLDALAQRFPNARVARVHSVRLVQGAKHDEWHIGDSVINHLHDWLTRLADGVVWPHLEVLLLEGNFVVERRCPLIGWNQMYGKCWLVNKRTKGAPILAGPA